jgi:hypothetical protein
MSKRRNAIHIEKTLGYAGDTREEILGENTEDSPVLKRQSCRDSRRDTRISVNPVENPEDISGNPGPIFLVCNSSKP